MGRIEKTVFISYRRTNFYTALAVYQDLTAHGYDVFFDYQSIDSGNFAKAILENIEARAHFVLVLSSSALERCSQPNDWLRREIETAIELKRNIVPLMMEGFDFGSPSTIQALSGNLSMLNTYNGLRLYSDYFFDAMEKLRTRFLNVAIDDLRSLEVSTETKVTNEVKKTLADEAPQVETQQITAEEWFERGYTFYESKNYNEAIRCYKEAINLEPNFEAAYNNLGIALNDLKLYDEAEVASRKAIELYEKSPSGDNPDKANAYYNLGYLLDDLKRYDEAEAAYRKAIQIDPTEASTYHNLGYLLDDLERYDEAEAVYRKAIELNPDDTIAYSNLGYLLDDLKRYDEAEAAYRKAIQLEPAYVTAYNNLANLLYDLNRYDEAEAAYRKIIELRPSDVEAYYNLGRYLADHSIKNYDDAEKTFSKVLELDSIHNETLYCLACIKSLQQETESAFPYLQKAITNGFDREWAWEDPDLQWVRDDPRFAEIVGPKPE